MSNVQDYNYTSERKTVSVVAGVDRKGQPFFREGSVPVIVNRAGRSVTGVTVLSDNGPRGRAVARLAPNAIILT